MKSRRGVFWVGLATILAGAVFAQSCGGSSLAAGAVGGSCLAGGTCTTGLVCLSEICVAPAQSGAAGSSGGAGGIAAGGAAGMGCTAATTMAAPASGLIADFMGADGGLEIAGGIYPYPAGSALAPAYSLTNGALHVTENAPATSAPQYLGIAIGFNDCIDATAFTGVRFTIGGSVSGCSMQYGSGDVEHQDSTTDAYLATGPAGSYPPQTTLMPGQITTAPQTLMMPFGAPGMFGSPQTPLDEAKLVLAIWQFTVAPGASVDGATPSCVADITLDDIAFY